MIDATHGRTSFATGRTAPLFADLRHAASAAAAAATVPVSGRPNISVRGQLPSAAVPHGDVPIVPDAPQLPEAPGSSDGATAMRTVHSFDVVSDHMAFMILQQAQMKIMASMAQMRRSAQQTVMEEGQRSVRELVRQIAGEQRAAKTRLCFGVVAPLTSAAAGFKGGQMRSNNQNPSLGAALEGSAQQLGNVVQSMGDLLDKVAPMGGTYMADQARIAQKDSEQRRSNAQQIADSSRSGYDQAKELLSAAVQIFSDYFRRKESLSSTISNQ